MNILIFTDKLKSLYNYVDNTGQKLEIRLKVSKSGEAGICSLKKERYIPYIEIQIREDRLNEDIVSHELLHALNIKKGYGSTCNNFRNSIAFGKIAALFHSVLEHKDIYKIQENMGIDITASQKHKAETIFNNIEEEPRLIDYNTIVNSLILLDCLIGSGEYKQLFIDRVRKNFKYTFELATMLEKVLFVEDIDNAELFRKKFIQGLRICDEYLLKHMKKTNPYFKLTENISISYIPSEYQLLLNAEQVFDFKETIDSIVIISKKDRQASFIIEKENNIEDLKKITVEELVGNIDGIITIRQK